MDPNLRSNILDLTLSVIFLSISLRAFFLYSQIRGHRLFILGLSMGMIALTAAADFTSGIITVIQLNTDWFLFIGQAVSFAFLLLSLLPSSYDSLRRLMIWHIVVSALLLFLLFLSPILPDFPNPTTQFFLSGSRSLICFLIFFFYVSIFMAKETRFSFLMGAAFLLLSIGYCLILPKYFLPHAEVLDQTGDVIRIFGLITLTTAYLQNDTPYRQQRR